MSLRRGVRLAWIGTVVWMLGAALCASAAEDPAPVSFSREIAPLLNRRCVTCHGEESAKGHYRLDTFARMEKPGESEEKPLAAREPERSQLYRLLLEPDPEDRMPQKADPLPSEEVALIKRWISEGARYDGGAEDRPLVEMARETMLRAAPAHYPHPVPITALAFSPTGEQLAVAGYYEVTLWNIADGQLVRRIGGLPERITSIAWSAKRNLIAVAGGSPAQWGTVALVDPEAEYRVRILCDLAETALSVAFNPDGSELAAGCGDRTVRLFETASGKQLHLYRQHADWVQNVSYNHDGTELVSASRDRTARVLDVRKGELTGTYSGHETALISAEFASESRVLSLATRSRELHRWNPQSPDDKTEKLKFDGEIQRFALSKFGLIVVKAGDNAVHVEQVADRQELFALQGHRDTVQAIALQDDGRSERFASGSFDGEIFVWDLACGTWTQRFMATP